MKIAPFLLCAQISCALVAALDGILSEGVKVSELFDRSQLAAENGYQVGYGQKGLPKRLWRREDQQSQVEKRSVETEQEDALTEGAKDKWTSFSEGLNTRERWVEVEKRSGGVFKRSDGQATSVTIGGLNITEEHLLGFILGQKNLEKSKCEPKLKGYCEGLGKVDKDFEKVHKMIKDICDDNKSKEKKKCEDSHLQKVKDKCETLKTELGKLDEKLKNPSKLEDKECKDNEQQCFFLGEADNELKGKCNKLREACYRKKRDKVAEEVLMRVLKGNLTKNSDKCEGHLKQECPHLGLQSDELLQKCLDPVNTCTDLKDKAKEKCAALKKSVETALGKKGDDTFKDECHPLLEQCHFYEPNCDGQNKPKCNELKDECEKKKVFYTPPGSIVNPIEYPASLLEKIGLDELYAKSASEGVVIGRISELDEDVFLMLVTLPSELSGQGDGCKNKLDQKCKDYKPFLGKIQDLCENDGSKASGRGKGKCQTLSQSLSNKCDGLKGLLFGIKVSDKSGNEESTLFGWQELSQTDLSEDYCTKLELQCLYFEKHCQTNKLGNACSNLRRACYRRALYDVAYVTFQKELRGRIPGIDGGGEVNSGEEKRLLEPCQQLRTKSAELFMLCMYLEQTSVKLRADIERKARQLKLILNDKRDSPERKDCIELQKQCWHVEADDYHTQDSCRTLKMRCELQRLSEDLKRHLLDARDGALKDQETCIKKVETECSHWNRRQKNRFTLPCALMNDSCELMFSRVRDHCDALNTNIIIQDIINVTKKDEEEKEKTCLEWMPHCYDFMINCYELVKIGGRDDGGDGRCVELNKTCHSVIKRWNNQGWLMYRLRGNLTNGKCKNNLDDLCMNWTKSENGTLSSFCKDASKDHDTYRTKLCTKLKKRIEEKCPVLKEKLGKVEKEVKNKTEEYKKLKGKAEDAIKEANLTLPENLRKEIKNATLVRRDVKSNTAVGSASASPNKPIIVEIRPVAMEKKHLKAVQLIFEVLDSYVELTDQCEELKLDCGFQEDCKECKTSCTNILKACGEIQPLTLMRPSAMRGECKPQTEKEESPFKGKEGEKGTSKEGKEGGKGQGGGQAGEGKNCTSIKTSDTWVTSTSTHTTTITSTSTKTFKVTLTSTRKCKPTKCTTRKPESTSKSEEEEVVPSGGKRWLPSVGIVIVGVVVAIM